MRTVYGESSLECIVGMITRAVVYKHSVLRAAIVFCSRFPQVSPTNCLRNPFALRRSLIDKTTPTTHFANDNIIILLVISPTGFLEDLLSHITFNEMYIHL